MLKRLLMAFAIMAAVFAAVSTPANAASVHLKGGAHAKPSFTDNGMTLTASGALAGLGNGDVRVNLTATANVEATCTNPSGHNQPPGQNPAPVEVTGTVGIPQSAIKNGTTPFSVTTVAPEINIVGAPDCPNVLWTEAITGLAFTSATITVEQPVGTTVLTVHCSFNRPTRDGNVPPGNVSCS